MTFFSNIKGLIKRKLMYPGARETSAIRLYIEDSRQDGWPYCPPDEGDVLYHLACQTRGGHALEIGMATGSTAGYMLAGIGDGAVTSIDYDQNRYGRNGVRLVHDLGYAARHALIESNSVAVLPRMWTEGRTFDVIFLDGWKTFDHMWVDVFYCAKMLKRGGVIMFDDARMPAVRKCISLLERYYDFERVNVYGLVGGWKQRVWHLLTSRSLRSPYLVLRKNVDIGNTRAGSRYDFWARF